MEAGFRTLLSTDRVDSIGKRTRSHTVAASRDGDSVQPIRHRLGN